MNIKPQLERRIRAKQQEIQGLENKKADIDTEIRHARAYLMGLEEALRLIPKETSEEKQVELVLRPGSDMAKVRDYLSAKGETAYITDILTGIGKEVNAKNRSSISGSLRNYANKNEIFTKEGSGSFGLIEFKAKLSHATEPPAGFGIDPSEEDGNALAS